MLINEQGAEIPRFLFDKLYLLLKNHRIYPPGYRYLYFSYVMRDGAFIDTEKRIKN